MGDFTVCDIHYLDFIIFFSEDRVIQYYKKLSGTARGLAIVK